MENYIFIKSKAYVFNGSKYFSHNELMLEKNLSNKRKIIIVGEDLWIKEVKVQGRRKYDEIVLEEIKAKGEGNNDLLYHYNLNHKRSSIIIYSIKKKRAVEELIGGARDIKIIPIQFIIVKEAMKRSRKLREELIILTSIEDIIYYTVLVKGIIIKGDIYNGIDEVNKALMEEPLEKRKIIYDDSITANEINIGNNCIKLEGEICESLFKKQGFYTR